MNLISTLIKIVHSFLLKIVHCFVYKQLLRFCIKLFYVHYLKNCSLFSHKTLSEIVFSKFKHQIQMLFHV